eukprot:16143355-Heterocapsa_arctica.AAC.1
MAPIGQWHGQDQREGLYGEEESEGIGRNPSRSFEQSWEWQAGHDVPTHEEEVNQGRTQEE